MNIWTSLDITDRLLALGKDCEEKLPASGSTISKTMAESARVIKKLRKEIADSANSPKEPNRFRIPTKYNFGEMMYTYPCMEHPTGLMKGSFDDGTGCEYCINDEFEPGRLTDEVWATEWLSYLERLAFRLSEAKVNHKAFLKHRNLPRKWGVIA